MDIPPRSPPYHPVYQQVLVDITDQEAARRILGDVRPEVLMLNAGTPPRTWGGSTS